MIDYLPYIQIVLTVLIAVMGFIMQFRLKKVELLASEKVVQKSKLTELEFTTYKELWGNIAKTIRATKYLRGYVTPTHTSELPTHQIGKIKLDNYLEIITALELSLNSNSIFISTNMVNKVKAIIATARLEYFQASAVRKDLDVQQMNQGIENIKKMEILFRDAESLFRQEIS